MLVEVIALRTLYERDHLDQVLATFGLILFFNELVAHHLGPRRALRLAAAPGCSGHIDLFTGSRYPLYRAVIIVVGLATALILWYVVTRTRLGMLIRAGATNRTMVGGARREHPRCSTPWCSASAPRSPALAGLMAGPIYTVQPGMGELSSSRCSS